jgi:hypothetical protein
MSHDVTGFFETGIRKYNFWNAVLIKRKVIDLMLDKMNAVADEEIQDAYESLGEDEFFDCGYDHDQVEKVLGPTVAASYTQWIYIHIK